MAEIWKPINLEDWGDHYEVSSEGRVRSRRTGKLRNIQRNPEGYNWIVLNNGKAHKWVHIAKIVALTFIPNPLGLQQVDHVNRNKDDNRVENLRWADSSTNGRNRGGFTHGSARPVAQFDLEGNYIATYESTWAAARATGVNQSSIWKVAKGFAHRNTAGGYIWRYYDERIKKTIK